MFAETNVNIYTFIFYISVHGSHNIILGYIALRRIYMYIDYMHIVVTFVGLIFSPPWYILLKCGKSSLSAGTLYIYIIGIEHKYTQ